MLKRLFEAAAAGVYSYIDSDGGIREYSPGSARPPAPSTLPAEDSTDTPVMVTPLTAQQLSLLYECLLRPESTAYQITAPIYFETPLEIERVLRTYKKMIHRHAALRTTFRRVEQQYVQWIKLFDSPQIETRSVDSASPERIEEWMVRDSVIPLDITRKGNVLYLYVLQNEVVACAFVGHHAVGDLSSAATIMDDWGRLMADEEMPAEEDPYVPFILEQISNESGRLAERNRKYWLERLNPLPKATELPTDYPRNPFPLQDSADYAFKIDRDLRRRMKTLASEHNSDELTVLLTALQVFLVLYTGDQDTSISNVMPTSARRKYPTVVGYGVQEAPLMASLDDQACLVSLLAANRRLQFQLFKHRDVSLLNLAPELDLEHDPSRAALAQVSIIAYPERGHNYVLRECSRITMGYRSARMDYGDVSIRLLPTKVPHWPHELSLISGYHPHGFLPLVFRYHSALFSRETIAQMADTLLHILKTLVDHPDKPIADLDLLPPDVHSKLEAWGTNPGPFDASALVPDRFEAQAARTPDAPALRFESQQLTYEGLNDRANVVARYLQADWGVSSGSPVGLLFDPSLEMIVSILGVLKAGGSFVPLDPDLPGLRLLQMAADAGLRVVLSHEALSRRRLPGYSVVDVCGIPAPEAIPGSGNPERSIAPEDLAYIFFTSGSTGTPKGVMLQQDAFLASQVSWNHSPGVDAEDRVLSVYNYAFDASLITNVAPLLAGACIVLASKAERQDPRLLIERMERESVTSMCATISHYRLLMLGGWEGSPQVKAVSAGEAFDADVADFLLTRCREVWNAYGPTEASNIVSTYRMPFPENPIPIGGPAANARLYILDPYCRPVPPGARGELHVGGVYVSSGYINRPALTADRFVPDPFSSETGAFMYRTGDVASFRNDGMLLFHGRNDRQVKIRGHRIEVKEIEQVFNRHPDISGAVVRPYTLQNGLQGLAAYLVPAAEGKIDIERVQDFIRAHLPKYMLPDPILQVDAIPLNQNGKLDLAALPAPTDRQRPAPSESTHASGRPAASREERIVRQAWKNALHREAFDPGENFFEAGGDSLSLMHVIMHIEKEIGIQVPLAPFVRAATLQEMVRTLGEIILDQSDAHSVLVPIVPVQDAAPLFCVTAGYGDLIAYQQWEKLLQPGRSFYVLQPTPYLPAGISAPELAVLYIKAMRSVQPAGPYHVMGHSFGGLIAVEMAQQLLKLGEQVDRLILIETLAGYPTEIGGALEWLASVLGRPSDSVRNRNLIEAMLRDAGWNIHLNAVKRYSPSPYPGDITYIVTPVGRAYLRPGKWKRLVRGNLEIKVAKGNHHTMLREHAANLLSLL